MPATVQKRGQFLILVTARTAKGKVVPIFAPPFPGPLPLRLRASPPRVTRPPLWDSVSTSVRGSAAGDTNPYPAYLARCGRRTLTSLLDDSILVKVRL